MDVSLDPATADPSLIFSNNLRQVWLSCLQQDLRDSPESFSLCPCVLGSPCFVEGRHHWEVEVRDKAKWAIGVCEDPVCRKEGVTVAPRNGFWMVSLWYGEEYWTLTSLMQTPLQRVGVWWGFSWTTTLVRSPSTTRQRGVTPSLLPRCLLGPVHPASACVTQEARAQLLLSSAPQWDPWVLWLRRESWAFHGGLPLRREKTSGLLDTPLPRPEGSRCLAASCPWLPADVLTTAQPGRGRQESTFSPFP